jgi:hypothetical protein
MNLLRNTLMAVAAVSVAMIAGEPALAQTPAKQPNIIMIMGDDIGWAI